MQDSEFMLLRVFNPWFACIQGKIKQVLARHEDVFLTALSSYFLQIMLSLFFQEKEVG